MMRSVEQRWPPYGKMATARSIDLAFVRVSGFLARATCSVLDRPTIELITRKHVETRTNFKERLMQQKDERTVLTAVDARGARLGRPMLVVLIVSTLTVIGIFSLLYYGTYG
jgi:hypothetical protein